ncbi:MAG: OsmC family protein [Bacteriovorax sp.]|nr:OsmC family protein [Bacteriovorax sp.]
MDKFIINIDWQRSSDDFSYDTYNRSHVIYVGGDQTIHNSAAPEYKGDTDMTNPEELFASSLASCHMMTFLAVASRSGYIVDNYECKAEAFLGKNNNGKIWVSEITLYPLTVFSGDKYPTGEQLKSLHDKAHANCFIAQSINTKVNVLFSQES